MARSAVGCTLFIMNMVFLVAGAGIVYLAYYMMTDKELEEVYGSGIATYAYWILGFGSFVMLTSFCGCAGSRTNKKRRARALLLTYAFVLLMLLALQTAVGVKLWEKFGSGTLSAECVRKGATAGKVKAPNGAPDIDCSDFSSNALRITAYAVWQRLYRDHELYTKDTQAYEGYKANSQLALSLTTSAKCCGFGAPVDTIDGTNEHRPGVPLPCVPNPKKEVFLGREFQYQVCASGATKADPGWYCKWTICNEASCGASSKSPKLVKDCTVKQQYDFPIGQCGGTRPNGTGTACYEYGCAEAIFDWLQRHIYVIVTILLVLVLAEIFGVLAACCVLNPVIIACLCVKEICLGVHKFLRGFHSFTKCLCTKICVCLPCTGGGGGSGGGGSGGGGGGDGDLEGGRGSGDDDVSWCGWASDCFWCCCCCWVCGVCMDSDKDDKKKKDKAKGRLLTTREAAKTKQVTNPLGAKPSGGTTL